MSYDSAVDNAMDWFVMKVLAPFCLVTLAAIIFIVIPYAFWASCQEKKNCLRWERTLVNHPEHWSGKIHMPESVEVEDLCVEVRK